MVVFFVSIIVKIFSMFYCVFTMVAAMGNASTTLSSRCRKVAEALESIRRERPPLRAVASAMEGFLVESARFNAEGWAPPLQGFIGVDSLRFKDGVPVLRSENLTAFEGAVWRAAAKRFIPPLRKGFHRLAAELRMAEMAISNHWFNLNQLAPSVVTGKGEDVWRAAKLLEIRPRVLSFALLAIIRPLASQRAHRVGALIAGFEWKRGYCPVCGSLPEMGYRGLGGQQRLICSVCSYHWPFPAGVCPFCEDESDEGRRYYSLMGHDGEWAEVCGRCGKYLLVIDARNLPEDFPFDVAAIGMLPLATLAELKGFTPMSRFWRNDLLGHQPVFTPVIEPESMTLV